MKRIYADFNAEAGDGRVALDTLGSLESLSRLGNPLQPGERVVLFDGEVEVQANVDLERIPGVPGYSPERHVWLALLDEGTWREQVGVPSGAAADFLEPVWEPLMETQRTG